ncbi:hypothetical protein D3C87_1990310 [compost metagenome]
MHRGGLVRLARQLEGAAVGCVQAGDHVEERGFACAVGANQAIDLASLNGDAHVGEGLQATKTLGNACNLQHHVFG